MRYHFARYAVAAIAAALLVACSTIDTIDSRAESMNESAAAYTNTATLLNIIRASEYEPLTFVTVTGIVGHNTLTGNLGLPTGTFGPNQTATQRLFMFGPNSISRAASNDFNVSVVDDPGSYQALMAPINPSTIGFFINQGYPRELLFYLFVDRLLIEGTPGNGGWYESDNRPFSAAEINDPQAASFMQFFGQLGTLLQAGLTVQVDRNAFPAAKAVPPFQICFDPNLPFPAYQSNIAAEPQNRSTRAMSGAQPLAARLPTTCDRDDWVKPKPDASAPSTKVETTVVLQGPGGPVKVQGPPDKAADARRDDTPPPNAAWDFKDDKGRNYRIYMRSAYAVYQYLGQLVAAKMQLDVLMHTDPADKAIITIKQSGFGESCFASTHYNSQDWCVPSTANNTKRVFALLHQLVGLNTTPSNQANTATVRTTP